MVRSLMSYISLPNFFCEYALLIVQDILNLVTSKESLLPQKNFGLGANLAQIQILESLSLVLKRDPSN